MLKNNKSSDYFNSEKEFDSESCSDLKTIFVLPGATDIPLEINYV